MTASAFSQARAKLSHTAFIELLEEVVVATVYGDGDYERFRGHRLLALDGSSLRLPNTAKTREHFGFISNLNGEYGQVPGQVEAKMTVLYDVLNEIPLAGKLDRGRVNDLVAGRQHLALLKEGDILLADRGFRSIRFFQEIRERKAHFVIRCPVKFYRALHQLLPDDEHGDVTVDVVRGGSTLPVRFVQLRLPSGEIELLATSLLDRRRYPRRELRKLYYMRWRIETYFQVLKSRLSIDNFSGKTVEAIMQDFYSTLFVSGLESVLTGEANVDLSEKSSKHPQKVNKAVSFHVIKQSVLKLILDPPPDFQERITELFQHNPTCVRPEREKPPRRSSKHGANRRSLYFQRYARKHVF